MNFKTFFFNVVQIIVLKCLISPSRRCRHRLSSWAAAAAATVIMAPRSLRRFLKLSGAVLAILFVTSFVFPELGPAKILNRLHLSLSRQTR